MLSSGVVTYKVTIGFDTLDSRLRPEMSVSASIITDVKQDVILVPNGAVKTESGKSYVEVLNDGQTPVQKSVAIGSSNSTETEITSGISTGDSVVTQAIETGSAQTTSTSSSSSSRSGNARIPGLGGFGR
jgi:hypothetical protein